MKTNNEKTIYYFDKDPGFDKLKNITNGYFTMLKTKDDRCVFMNENGEYSQPLNIQATDLFGIKIYGNIAIVG